MRSHLSAISLGALLGCSPPPLPPPGAAPAPSAAPGAPAAESAAAAPSAPASSASAATHGPGPGAPVLRVEKPFSVALRLRPEQNVQVFQTDPPLIAVWSPSSPPQFFSFERGKFTRAAGLTTGWPPGASPADASIVGSPRNQLWALVPDAPADAKNHRVFEGFAAGWKLAGRVVHPEGGPVAISPQGPDLLALAHGDASMVPVFTRIASGSSDPGQSAPPPRFTETPRHPNKCRSQITMSYGFKAFPSGEVVVVGASCWVPTLQIERWGKGQKKSDAREIKRVMLQDIAKINVLGPDDIVLEGVSLEPPPPDGPTLKKVKLSLSKGVWSVEDLGPYLYPDAEDENGAKNKLDSMGIDFFQGFTVGQERFYLAGYPKKKHAELALLRVGEGEELDLR